MGTKTVGDRGQCNVDRGGHAEQQEDHQPETSVPAQFADLARRRKRPDEFEEMEAHTETPKEQTPAQLRDWEPMRDLVASVESIWDLLDHTRIHVTSTEDIEELDSKRVPNRRRLWSWSRDEKDQFGSQINCLLKEREFRLVMVSSNRASGSRSYSTVSEHVCWTTYYEFKNSQYWLAILCPPPEAGRSWKKVMRTAERLAS